MLTSCAAPKKEDISETKKQSAYFNKLTGDHGDVRVFKTTGKAAKTYLRLWVGSGHKASDSGGPQWYEVTAAPVGEAATPLDTK